MSPLGKYSQVVAAGLAIAIVGVYLLALLFGTVLAVTTAALDALDKLAFLAAGAVFGAAATLNGVKAPLDSAHNRIDKLEVATGIPTHGAHLGDVIPPGGVTHSSDVERLERSRLADRTIDGHPPGR